MDVSYSVKWSDAETNAWELGLVFVLPKDCSHLSWLRDAQWTAYPPDHIGSVTGIVEAKDTSFAATKRNTIWATMTDDQGDGVAILRSNAPLLVRGKQDAGKTELFTSTAEFAPRSFSSRFLDEYRIVFKNGITQEGFFVIRLIRGINSK